MYIYTYILYMCIYIYIRTYIQNIQNTVEAQQYVLVL